MNTFKTNTIKKITPLLLENGYRDLSIDEIISHLGCSKKTFYKYYSSKTELIKDTISYREELLKNIFKKCQKESNNAIIEYFSYIASFLSLVSHIQHKKNSAQIYKYYPSIYKYSINKLNHLLISVYTSNISRGLKEGLYTVENQEKSAKLLAFNFLNIGNIDPIVNDIYDDSTFQEYFYLMHSHNIRSLLSIKGIKYLTENFDIIPEIFKTKNITEIDAILHWLEKFSISKKI